MERVFNGPGAGVQGLNGATNGNGVGAANGNGVGPHEKDIGEAWRRIMKDLGLDPDDLMGTGAGSGDGGVLDFGAFGLSQ